MVEALRGVAAALLLGCFAGCASSGVQNPAGVPVTEMKADERGFVAGTGVESQDLVAVTDKMARSILGVPEIANAVAPPRILLEPVLNETRFPINKQILLTRIRVQLNAKAMGKVRFLDRSMMKALNEEEDLRATGAVATTPGHPAGKLHGADYFLTGVLQSISTRTSAGISDYVLYAFRLTDARTSEIIWEDSAEIKKQGLEDAVYR
jgi:PBP1b-binding outer membrane lipoprotein LpoB